MSEAKSESNKRRFHELMRVAGAVLVTTDPYERWKLTITPHVADALLGLRDEFQRPIGVEVVRRYARAQENEEWIPYVDPLMITSEHWTLLDGQHRCAAIKKSGVPQPFEIVVRPRATIVALDQRKARSVSHTDSAIRMRPPLSIAVQAAVEIALFGPHPLVTPTRTERGLARDKFNPASIEFARQLTAKTLVRLPSSVIAVAIQAHEKHPAESREFFFALAQNRPVAMGREWSVIRYMCAKILAGRDRVAGRDRAGGGHSRRELYVRTANAWNSFISGKDIAHTKYRGDSEIPVVA